MFVYSVKAGTLKFLSLVVLTLAAVITLAVFTRPESVAAGASVKEEIKYSGVKTAEDAREFLRQFGWETEKTPVESGSFTLPDRFDRAMAGYNEIQRAQGLDLSKYMKKTVTRYTFTVTNYEGYEGTVYANVIVYKNKVIGGDISSASLDGFLHGFSAP